MPGYYQLMWSRKTDVIGSCDLYYRAATDSATTEEKKVEDNTNVNPGLPANPSTKKITETDNDEATSASIGEPSMEEESAEGNTNVNHGLSANQSTKKITETDNDEATSASIGEPSEEEKSAIQGDSQP